MRSPDIVFPHLGIEIAQMDPVAFTIFNIDVYWYGIIIVTGVIAGLLLASYRAKKNGENPEIYSDYLLYGLISAILGARIYYVAFAWDDYKDNWIDIFAMREGGLAIYGGVIGAVIALIIFTRVKKLSFLQMADTAIPGLALGQMIGRIGNFINMEAFGGYTDSLFAMALKAEKAKIPASMREFIAPLEGYEGLYLQVQPTFAYESIWNLGVVLFLVFYTKHQKFQGEIFALYFFLYGLGRSWIEALRTDQLLLGSTNIPISQLLSIILVFVSGAYILWQRKRVKKESDI